MQSDALNKQILHDQFEKSEPHATDLINCLNKSKHRNYREYYNIGTLDHVLELYKNDIELFDYSF